MFHTCVQKFDVTGNIKKFCKISGNYQTHACAAASASGRRLAKGGAASAGVAACNIKHTYDPG
jgi:hypothetical protein